MFSENGAFLESWGGRGDGPGEFRGFDGLFLLSGDTVGVYDLGSRRYSLFDSQGEFLAISSRHPQISFTAGFLGSELLATYRDFPPGGPGITEAPPLSVSLVTFDGDTITGLGPFPGRQGFEIVRDKANYGLELLLAPRTHVAAGPLGVWVGHASSPKISLFSKKGEKVTEVGMPFERRRTTEADILAFVDRYAPPGGTRPEWREAHLEMVEAVLPPDSLPWFDEMLSDLTGGLWVREYPSAESESWDWWRLDPGVGSVTRARLPRRLRRVYQLTEEFVIGVEFGEFGEPMVVLYDLLPDT